MRRPAALLLALALSACASPPPPPAPATPPAPAGDEAGARQAASAAFTSLSKRNYDVGGCSLNDVRLVDEKTAHAGSPVGERCTTLVARRPDRTWLVVIRTATTAAPSRGGGTQAVVTVTAGGEGVTHIEYEH